MKTTGRTDKEIPCVCIREMSTRRQPGKREYRRKDFYERGGVSVREIERMI